MKETGTPIRSRCMLRISIADMVSLGVRTRGLKKPELPETLYQHLPMMGMALMATLPYGDCSVSIPGACGVRPGYPILATPALSADGFVIVYNRRTDGWYEAGHTLYQGAAYAIEEWIPVAKQWIEQHCGRLTPIKDRYAYFIPSLQEWDVVRRDGGYAAWDGSAMPQEILPAWPAALKSPHSSGMVARIPVFKGEKIVGKEVVPVFSQVDVMPDPDSPSVWIGFEEFKRERILRSRLPDSMVADFQEWLVRLTEVSGFDYWIFSPGMLHGDCMEWWGDGNPRRTEHEGIDFANGFRSGEGIRAIAAETPVHSLAEGEIIAILDDFIGKSVVVRHPDITRENGDVFHTLLSHIQPEVAKFQSLAKGHRVGRVGRSARTAAPMHLHLSGAWIPKNLAVDEVGLNLIHPAYTPVSLADFNPALQNNPLCRFEIPPGN